MDLNGSEIYIIRRFAGLFSIRYIAWECMISRGRLSKSSLRVNKTKWCSRGSVCEKHFTNHWMGPKRSGDPRGENFLSTLEDFPLPAIKIKVWEIKLRQKKSFLWDIYANYKKYPKRGKLGENWPDFLPPGIISGIIRRESKGGGGVNFPVSGRSENCWQNGCNLTTRP